MKTKTLGAMRGWSQEALPNKAGLARAYIARPEIGRHAPSLSTLVKLAKALTVTRWGSWWSKQLVR
jgi:transcriptional regulator with XRE-family HTH domain